MEIFEYFEENRLFCKFWRKSRSTKFLANVEIFQNFNQNRDFSKILTRIAIFVNFNKKIEIFRIFLTKIKTYVNFQENRDFQKFLPKIEIFRKFWPKWKSPKNVTKIAIFLKYCQNEQFWRKSRFSTILNKIRISKFVTKIENLRKFWPNSRDFIFFLLNRDFCKFWRKSTFL